MSRYLDPIAAMSGALHQQPDSDQTLSGWSLDQGLNYTRMEFLDAPDIIPSGSVRGLDCGSLTIGLAHNEREAAMRPRALTKRLRSEPSAVGGVRSGDLQ